MERPVKVRFAYNEEDNEDKKKNSGHTYKDQQQCNGGDNIDECDDGSHDCSDAANCKNTAGAFDCSCQSGHLGDGRHFCSGIS
ncbi:hypothetical protein pdam_00003116 [Pocillopora damicornis]|uniref:EGF-like domain-containing protein n=1 Tax=Pocillopora damicornis TaxID=46731 RepID=A0A3M6T9Q0_POCDA|nr:hypothetical protein pdam_00003116 [Pocillopora damicornis]